jgi:Family of unknown function (DUF5906)
MFDRASLEEQRTVSALTFRSDLEALVACVEGSLDWDAYGPHAHKVFEMSFAQRRSSYNWFTMPIQWSVLIALLRDPVETTHKDSIILSAGPLTGGKGKLGTRKVKENVEGLDLVVLDFDKGDAPLEKLRARLSELGLESAAYATYSHLKDETALAWSVTRPNAKTGESETLASAFQTFARKRLGFASDAACSPDQVTNDVFQAFLVEEQGYSADILGDVTIVKREKVEKTKVKDKSGRWRTVETCYLVATHRPLAKSRLVLPLARRYRRQPDETKESFQSRWQNEVYLPVGQLIGFQFDRVCASTERGHYAMTRKKGIEPVPLVHVEGRLLDLDDPGIKALLDPFKISSEKPDHQRPKRSSSARSQAHDATNDWRGFKAADAAADMLANATDKRSDENNPLVAFPCPFVHEHATSNDPASHQCYAYNASSANKLPTVKCQSDTCQGRPYAEFLDALFEDSVRADPAYRVAENKERTGVYIPEQQLEEKLYEINETWAVVRVGNRVRYLHETADGDIELYDAKSLADWFGNWIYYWYDDLGRLREAPIIRSWQKWEFRRQYHGVGFWPQPEGAPKGTYNTYYGFSIEPKRGSWKRLLGHIYRNVCKRDPTYFRFFIAWLAQLVQQPHTKSGTNIVLKGKEGVGKSKVGEWIVALFGRNAIVVSEAERITGRFNAHLENKLFLMAEEAFWAGDKSAEGKLKDLATGMNMSYERKGLDPYEGKNYTRIMIASNEDWVVPASSGGRRWFVLEVGDEHEKDYAYFAAIDQEMEAGGLAAMLYDLQHSKLPAQVNVRSAPVTPWLIEQRLHSYDNKRRWWRGVLLEGGFRDTESERFIALAEDSSTAVKRDDLFSSARRYFLGPKGVDPSPSEVGQFVRRMLGKLPESRPTIEGRRHWCTIFPPLKEMRQLWLEETGEVIEDDLPPPDSSQCNVPLANGEPLESDGPMDPHVADALAAAADKGITDPRALAQIATSAAVKAKERWRQLSASIPKTQH